MQECTGFEYQNALSGNCAQRSLVHALLLNGISITEKDAHKFTGVPKWLANMNGTDEHQLMRGIKRAQCSPLAHQCKDGRKARKLIDTYLSKGIPIIISVDDESHWSVLSGKSTTGKYYYIDSYYPEFFGASAWEVIEDWMCSYDDSDNEVYYFIGVQPKDLSQLRHGLVKNYPSIYKKLFNDDERTQWWGYYLEDLTLLFDCPRTTGEDMTAEDFFNKYGKMIYDASCYWYGEADESVLHWEFDNYRKIALAHNLSISQQKIPEAIAGLSAALTCIASVDV